jgi:hypothetical protein
MQMRLLSLFQPPLRQLSSPRPSRHQARPQARRRLIRQTRHRRLAGEPLEPRQLLATVVVNFADLALAPNSYWNGPNPNGVDEPDPYGGSQPVKVGAFNSAGASFVNKHNLNWGSWSGFAYSNTTDTANPSFTNQFSSFAGSGRGDANFGVAAGHLEASAFNPNDAAQLAQLPNFTLPAGAAIQQAYVTNTTYTALSMLHGDDFAKRFGGQSGNDPDWFKLTAYGTTPQGTVLSARPEIYLADYRFEDNSRDFVLADWTRLDLSSLAGAERIYFNLTSSDVSTWGMNTPALFTIDDIAYTIPNRAPALNTSLVRTLTPIAEDQTNSWGTPVWMLLNGLHDPDPGALRGAAITGLSGTQNGTWQFTLNGGNAWHTIGTVSNTQALVLPSKVNAARLRFVPKANFNGTVNVTYRAWDRTDEAVAGTKVNLTLPGSTGGSGAYSTAQVSASLTVTPVNDAPWLNPHTVSHVHPAPLSNRSPWGTPVWQLLGGSHDVDGDKLGIAIVAANSSGGSWQYTVNNAQTWQPLGSVGAASARLLAANENNTRVRFVPGDNYNGQASLTYRAWDRTLGTSGGTANLTQTGTGGITAFSAQLRTARPANAAPEVSGVGGSVGHTLNGTPILLAEAARVSDVDSPHFDRGYLLLRITEGADSGNRLSIGGNFVLSRVDDEVRVMHSNRQIGTLLADGFGTRNLRVNFTSAATPAIAQELLRSITFRTQASTSLTSRVVSIVLSDGGVNGVSVPRLRTVNVSA